MLGGGLVPGAVVLLAGEPGVGKSTLLLDVAAKAASAEHRTLYVTGEESASQVRLRADRIEAIDDHLYLAAETDLSAVLGHLDEVKPSLLILDSVQTVASPEIDGAPGGMAQVREVAGALIRASKERGMSTLLVGHVTKDGAIAGPRLLEHLVDVVLSFEGDRHARLRLVRGRQEPLRRDRRGRLLRTARRGHHGARRPVGTVPHPPGRAGARHLSYRHPGGPPATRRRGAGADRRLADPLAPAHHLGPGDLTGLDDACRAGAARPDQRAGQARHLLRDRRRGEAHRTRRRPGGRAGAGFRFQRHTAAEESGRDRRGGSGRRGQDGSPGSSAGWPRRTGWASPTRSCHATRARSRPV